MKIYIAGPMTGIPEFNFPAFNAAAAELRDAGHDAVNPAEIVPDTKVSWLDCMRADIKGLVDCDAIFLLPGYEKSKGASLELHIAMSLGLVVLHALPVEA